VGKEGIAAAADATYWVRLGEGDILDQQSDSTDTRRNDCLPCHDNVARYPLPFVSIRQCEKATNIWRVRTRRMCSAWIRFKNLIKECSTISRGRGISLSHKLQTRNESLRTDAGNSNVQDYIFLIKDATQDTDNDIPAGRVRNTTTARADIIISNCHGQPFVSGSHKDILYYSTFHCDL
jgi:hypothetical protein